MVDEVFVWLALVAGLAAGLGLGYWIAGMKALNARIAAHECDREWEPRQ